MQTNFQLIAETEIMLKNKKNPTSTIACEDYIEHADKWSVNRWNFLQEKINIGITKVTVNSAQETHWCIIFSFNSAGSILFLWSCN